MTINKHTIGLNETPMSGVFFLSFFLATTVVSTVAITIAIVNQRLDTSFSSVGGFTLGRLVRHKRYTSECS